jgi:hypothetical protein
MKHRPKGSVARRCIAYTAVLALAAWVIAQVVESHEQAGATQHATGSAQPSNLQGGRHQGLPPGSLERLFGRR